MIKKFFVGTHKPEIFERTIPMEKEVQVLLSIWKNEGVSSFGLERVARLVLAATQLLAPVLLIKILFSRFGLLYKKLAVEVYVVFKIIFPLLCIFLDWHHPFFLVLNTIFLSETVLYLCCLVFLGDMMRPHSYRRALLFTFLNYIEIALAFASVYDYLNQSHRFSSLKPFANEMEVIYFSFVTSASIGYGDFAPNHPTAQLLVILQSIIFFLFIAIFMGFFVSKIGED